MAIGSGHKRHAGAVSGPYPREHERRCRSVLRERRAYRHRRVSRHRQRADRHDRRAEAPAFAPRRVRATARANADSQPRFDSPRGVSAEILSSSFSPAARPAAISASSSSWPTTPKTCNSPEQGSVNPRLASWPALLRQLSREVDRAPCLARLGGRCPPPVDSAPAPSSLLKARLSRRAGVCLAARAQRRAVKGRRSLPSSSPNAGLALTRAESTDCICRVGPDVWAPRSCGPSQGADPRRSERRHMLRSEICVLDRIGPPNRQARPLASRAALLAFLESLQQAQTMLRRQARSPAAASAFDRGQHISERNIGRRSGRGTRGAGTISAIVRPPRRDG